MRPTTSIASAATLVAAAALGGCGLKEVDHAQIERAIGKDVAARAGVAGVTVTCPKNKSADKGTTFDCSVVQPSGQTTKVRVEMLDGGKFTYGPPR